ncbi:hypothetical protein [Microbispora bryophytorum]|uniref:hypothetical protein n=1 Tax=Microbispora bryophytorum TaxID=1460882 RepID=UPI003716D5D2
MEDYQRALIGRMVERLDLYASGRTPLPQLVEDLWGLFEASDPRELEITDSFQWLWSDLDGECELRIKPAYGQKSCAGLGDHPGAGAPPPKALSMAPRLQLVR